MEQAAHVACAGLSEAYLRATHAADRLVFAHVGARAAELEMDRLRAAFGAVL